MVNLKNENIIKLIFRTFSLQQVNDYFNKTSNTILSNIILRTYSYKLNYKSIGKNKFLFESQNYYNSINLLPNDNLITLTWGNLMTIWNPKDFSIIKTIDCGYINSLAVLPNGFIVTNSDMELRVFDINDNYNCIKTKPLYKLRNSVCLSLLLNGCLAYASRSENSLILIIDCNNDFECIKRIDCNKVRIHSIIDLPKQHLFSGHNTGCIKVFNITDDYKYIKTLTGHMGLVTSLLYINRYNVLLLSGSEDCKIKFWNANDYHCIKTIGNSSSKIYGLLLLPFNYIAVLTPKSIKIINFNGDYECINTIEYENILFKSFLLLKDNSIASVINHGWKLMILDKN
jgi:WD40 repeat protein